MADGKKPERTARRNRRGARSGPVAPAYVTRKIPHYALLDEEALDRMEQACDDLLADIGIEYRGDDEALELFRGAGATVTGERIRFDRGQVRSLCSTAPAQFTQHARNPARSVEIGGKIPCSHPLWSALRA